jgi:hypothetical protein
MREHHYWIIGDLGKLLEFGHPSKALSDIIGLTAKRLVVIRAKLLVIVIVSMDADGESIAVFLEQ